MLMMMMMKEESGGDEEEFREVEKVVDVWWYNKYEREASRYWDLFYKRNRDNFFKDRHYLMREFGVLEEIARTIGKRRSGRQRTMIENEKEGNQSAATSGPDAALLELGCGAGNALLPLMVEMEEMAAESEKIAKSEFTVEERQCSNQKEGALDRRIMFYACDFSARACKLTQDKVNAFLDIRTANNNSEGSKLKTGWSDVCELSPVDCKVFQCDPSSSIDSLIHCGVPKQSVDVVLCIFVLSAMSPAHMQLAINAIKQILREKSNILSNCNCNEREDHASNMKYAEGGLVLVRDYAAGDLAEVRLNSKKSSQIRKLDENFYVRGDGTVSELKAVLSRCRSQCFNLHFAALLRIQVCDNFFVVICINLYSVLFISLQKNWRASSTIAGL